MILDRLFKCKHPAKFLGIYEDCTTERCEDFNKITYHLFFRLCSERVEVQYVKLYDWGIF